MKLEPCMSDEIIPDLNNIVRDIEDEGDRCYLGSTNDADRLREIADWLETNFRRTPPASQSDEALVIPGQIPPFLSAPTFDDRAEQRVCINGCLYLRADFAGERQASAHAAGRREGIEEAAKVADAGTGLAHVSEAHAMASARARSIAQNIRALAEKQP